MIKSLLAEAQNIAVIQAENPDGDSLGSSLALEEILGDQEKNISLYCPVETPKYLRYYSGWDRINSDLDTKADLFIIVDTASQILLSKVINNPAYAKALADKPVIVIDHHHEATPDLQFDHHLILKSASSTSEIIFNLAQELDFEINSQAAEHMLAAIMSDTLGLTTPNITAETFFVAGKLTNLGGKISLIEEKRREFMKKAPEILEYKGKLIERIEYFLNGELALVHIPWEEIRQYSDKYNPSVLVIDEMRLVENVKISVALKTYPDGKLTGKIRTNVPVAAELAGYFGGGGHAYAAGFRVYEDYDTILRELINASDKILKA